MPLSDGLEPLQRGHLHAFAGIGEVYPVRRRAPRPSDSGEVSRVVVYRVRCGTCGRYVYGRPVSRAREKLAEHVELEHG